MKDIDLSGLGEYVSETLSGLSGSPDKSYQSQGLYKKALTAVRTINVFLCIILVVLFVLAGGS